MILVDPTSSALKTEELSKLSYENEFTRKSTIDEKANSLMSIAGTVATLYGGFGLTIATDLFNKNLQINFQFFTLFVGVSSLVACIFFAAKAYLLRQYNYPINYDNFITKIQENNNIVFKQDVITKYQSRDPAEFNTLMIKIYARCAALNYRINEHRARDLYVSQIIFFVGLFTIPLFILASLI